MSDLVVLVKNEGRGTGSGPEGGDCGQRWCGQIQHDPEVLQRHLYERLQKNHWSGLLRKTNRVSKIKSNFTNTTLLMNNNNKQRIHLIDHCYCSRFPTPTLSFTSFVPENDSQFHYY